MTILERILTLLGFDSRDEPAEPVDIAASLDARADAYARAHGQQRLDWRRSVVDLMKLLDMDSGHDARVELAAELNYPGVADANGMAMNIWLHREIMRRVEANGGKVPKELL